MKNTINNNKSKIIIDDIGKEYIDLLISTIKQRKHLSINDAIDYKDLIIVNDEMKKKMFLISNKRERLIRIIIMTGILYALVGFMLYIYSNIPNTSNNIGIIITFAGIFISSIGYIFGFLSTDFYSRKLEKEIKSTDKYEIIDKWNTIEKLTNDYIRYKTNIDNDHIPISKKIKILTDKNILTNQYINILKDILNTRNNIVHNNYSNLNDEEIKFIVNKANDLINVMQSKK